jgi:hypothetical protein
MKLYNLIFQMVFLIVRYINKMATDRGGGVADDRHSNDCKRDTQTATSRLCFCCLLSNGVTVSHPPSPHHVSSSRLSPLPYLMAGCQCQVIAPSGPRHALSDASARGIGAKGPFLPAAAMVVMVVVVGCWRPRGMILWSAVFF